MNVRGAGHFLKQTRDSWRRKLTTPELAGTAFPVRLCLLVLFFVLILSMLFVRLIYAQGLGRATFVEKGNRASVASVAIPARRGMITDRNGKPLAVSTPLIRVEAGKALWAEPKTPFTRDDHRNLRLLAQELGYTPEEDFVGRVKLKGTRARWPELAAILGEPQQAFSERLEQVSRRHSYDLAKGLSPEYGEAIGRLKIPGVFIFPEYRRYYPAAEVTAQLVGLVNIDGKGQEGVELAFDRWLAGVPGKRRERQGIRGRTLADLGVLQEAHPGKDLQLSIDLRLQNLAYRELYKGLQQSEAKAASLVMVDVRSSEILAIVNHPAHNPNSRTIPTRNRALVDSLEPGSTVKPLTMTAALESGRWKPEDTVDLEGRRLYVDRFSPITDVTRSGPQKPNLTQILIDSSNVGASKIALDIGPESIRDVMHRLGVGQSTGLAFPGESPGMLPAHKRWTKRQIANLSYGYGVEMTLVQLAQIYVTLANDGYMRPLSLFRLDKPKAGEQVIDRRIAKTVRDMLQEVVESPRGAHRARVPGYLVAGKSGTADKTEVTRQESGSRRGAYGGKTRAFFVGFAPASSPRFVVAVMLDEPEKKQGQRVHFGGAAAAPVFSRVMAGALRLMQVPPDAPVDIEEEQEPVGEMR